MLLAHATNRLCTPARFLARSSTPRTRRVVPHIGAVATSPTTAAPASAATQQEVAGPSSVYIHLPFCKRKCFYCDFPVVAVGSAAADSERLRQRMQVYLGLLQREVLAAQRFGTAPLRTVYFGGGTPSLVPPDLIAPLLQALDARFGLAADAEITLEADPGTFDLTGLQRYMALGVNRLSVGVQAFQQELLEACGRSHSQQEVYAAADAIHASGIRSWSLDLISGLPRLTMDMWQRSLAEAVKLQPAHISIYDLQVEEGTPFATWQAKGKLQLPRNDLSADMYVAAADALRQAGYEHYEVSNYAKPGHRSSHNQVYWRGIPYYAFGLGAASYLAGRRYSRPKKMDDYTAWVNALPAGGSFVPGGDLPAETEEDVLLDTIMLRLRTADGLSLQELANAYGQDVVPVIASALKPHCNAGHVLCRRTDGQPCGLDAAAVVRLSDPEGFMLSNDIISDVFAAFDPAGTSG